MFFERRPSLCRMLGLMALCIVSAALSSSAHSQKRMELEQPETLYFKVGKADFDPLFRDNAETMRQIVAKIDSLNLDPATAIRSIKVSSSTSPEGGKKLNVNLASERSRSIVRYLMTIYPRLTQQIVISSELAPDWNMLHTLVEKDRSMSNRSHVLDVLDIYRNYYNEDYSVVDPRERTIRQLNGGKVWKYMLDNMFPDMRYATVELLHDLVDIDARYMEQIVAPQPAEEPEPQPEELEVVEEEEEIELPAEPQTEKRFILALKTNLLYDVVGALNGEIEIPVADRWSVQTEAVWPWMVSRKDKWCMQMGLIDGEVRHWLGQRHIGNPIDPERKINPLTGQFIGLTGGWGYYDFERKSKGYQGKLFMVGLTYGYSMRLNRNLNMEFSLGLGYMRTHHRHYFVKTIESNGETKRLLVEDSDGVLNWFGPIKAKISLSWLLFNTRKK